MEVFGSTSGAKNRGVAIHPLESAKRPIIHKCLSEGIKGSWLACRLGASGHTQVCAINNLDPSWGSGEGRVGPFLAPRQRERSSRLNNGEMKPSNMPASANETLPWCTGLLASGFLAGRCSCVKAMHQPILDVVLPKPPLSSHLSPWQFATLRPKTHSPARYAEPISNLLCGQ